MYRILLVEDDETIAAVVRRHLESWGYTLRCVRDFEHVLGEFTAFEPQLVLLDISLPFFNGYHWCTQIRAVSKVPVLFLSSSAENMNVVMAMEMGGDDFIAKPFDLQVLSAKVAALLRRCYDFAGTAKLLEWRGAVLNLSDATLCRGEERIELTKNEYRVLQVLFQRRGEIVGRDVLMSALWESDCFVDENTLSVNVARLRKKLDAAGLPDFIRTVKGVGYGLTQ